MDNYGMQPGGPGGPVISGKWYNKRLNKTIIVRDCILDGETMQILTSDNEMIDGAEFSRDYIQCDSTVYDESGKSTGKTEEVDYESMFKNTERNSLDNTSNINSKEVETISKFANKNNSDNEYSTIAVDTTVDNMKMENMMIDKLFKKLKSIPVVSAHIEWDNVPKQEINMMQMFFDITDDAIVDYIFTNYCNIDQIKQSLKESLKEIL